MPPKRKQNRQKNHNKNSSKEPQPPAKNAMADCILPENTILSILYRLPVKSLVRFKCVCKPWYSLLSNPSFVKMHAQKFPHFPKTFSFQSHVLKCPRLGIDPPKKLTLVNNPYEIYLDACNGLVCMGRPLYTKDIVLWNPATSMHKFLPPSTVDLGAAAAMVSLGFGCSADGDDYKVVRISILKGKKMRVGVEVYSSASDSWRKMDLNLEYKFTLLEHKNHVIVNGNPYWLALFYEKKIISEGRECQVLLGFDSTRMEFLFVPMPTFENMDVMSEKLPFVNWKGRVGLLSCAMKDDDDDWLEWIDIFVYDDGDRQWKRDATFGPVEVEAVMCLDVSRAGKIVGGCPDGRLFMYDPEKNRVGVSKLRKRERCTLQMLPYEESLVHLKGMVPVVVKKEDHGNKFNDIEGFFVSSFHHGSGEISCYYALAF